MAQEDKETRSINASNILTPIVQSRDVKAEVGDADMEDDFGQ